MQNISPELAAYNDVAHIAYQKLPPHNPACTRTFQGQAPVITSLTNGMTYLITDKEQQKLQLSCTAANDVHKVYWYINDHFFSASEADKKMFFSATAPILKISCTDDKGRNTNIEIKVRFIWSDITFSFDKCNVFIFVIIFRIILVQIPEWE